MLETRKWKMETGKSKTGPLNLPNATIQFNEAGGSEK
jgi:hypothetical protein